MDPVTVSIRPVGLGQSRLEDFKNLKETIQNLDVPLDIDVRDKSAAKHGTLFEILIFAGSGIATSLLNDAVTDAYNLAKGWARERVGRHNTSNAPSIDIVIRYPGSTYVIEWHTDSDSEEEADSNRDSRE
jgi:hypothetical protein